GDCESSRKFQSSSTRVGVRRSERPRDSDPLLRPLEVDDSPPTPAIGGQPAEPCWYRGRPGSPPRRPARRPPSEPHSVPEPETHAAMRIRVNETALTADLLDYLDRKGCLGIQMSANILAVSLSNRLPYDAARLELDFRLTGWLTS